MPAKTDDEDPATDSCSSRHNLLEHRAHFHDLLWRHFSPIIFKQLLFSEGCRWKCCKKEIPPADWPMLLEESGVELLTSKSLPSPGSVPTRSYSVIKLTPVSSSSAVIKSTSVTTASTTSSIKDVEVGPQCLITANSSCDHGAAAIPPDLSQKNQVESSKLLALGESEGKQAIKSQQPIAAEQHQGNPEVIDISNSDEDVRPQSDKNCNRSTTATLSVENENNIEHWKKNYSLAATPYVDRGNGSRASVPTPTPNTLGSSSDAITCNFGRTGTGASGGIPLGKCLFSIDACTGEKLFNQPRSYSPLKKMPPYKVSRCMVDWIKNGEDGDDSLLTSSTEREMGWILGEQGQQSFVESQAQGERMNKDLADYSSNEQRQQHLLNNSRELSFSIPTGPSSDNSLSETETITERLFSSDTSNLSDGLIQAEAGADLEETREEETRDLNNLHQQRPVISAYPLLDMTGDIVCSQSDNSDIHLTASTQIPEFSTVQRQERSLCDNPPELKGSGGGKGDDSGEHMISATTTSGTDSSVREKGSVVKSSFSSSVDVLVAQVHQQSESNQQAIIASVLQNNKLVVQGRDDPNVRLSDYLMSPQACTGSVKYCIRAQVGFPAEIDLEEQRATHHHYGGDSNDEERDNEQSNCDTARLGRRRSKRKRKKSEKLRSWQGVELDSNDDDEPVQNSNGVLIHHPANTNQGPNHQEPPASKVGKVICRRKVADNSKNKGGAIKCPYCCQGVSTCHQFAHLDICPKVTLEQKEMELKKKGTVDWEPAPCTEYAKYCRKRGRRQAAVTNIKRGSQSQGPATSESHRKRIDLYSSNSEEPRIKKKSRNMSSKVLTLRSDQQPSKKFTTDYNSSPVVAGPSNLLHYLTVFDPPPATTPDVVPVDKTEDEDDQPHGSILQLALMPADMSVSLPLEADNLKANCVVYNTPSSAASSQLSTMTTTTAVSTSSMYRAEKKSRKMPRTRCRKPVTLTQRYMARHQQSTWCDPNRLITTGSAETRAITDYESQAEMEDEQLVPAPTRQIRDRRRRPKQGRCPYCEKPMLWSSVRNHVLNKVCPETRAAHEKGDTLEYCSQAEDSQTENDDEYDVVIADFKKRSNSDSGAIAGKVPCPDCGQLMLKPSLRNHTKQNRCKGRPGNLVPSTSTPHQDSVKLISEAKGYSCKQTKYKPRTSDDNYNLDDKISESDADSDRVVASESEIADMDMVGEDFICPYYDCGCRPADKSQYQLHDFEEDPKVSGYSCPKCNKIFFERKNLADHAMSHVPTYHHDATNISVVSNPALQPNVILQKLQRKDIIFNPQSQLPLGVGRVSEIMEIP